MFLSGNLLVSHYLGNYNSYTLSKLSKKAKDGHGTLGSTEHPGSFSGAIHSPVTGQASPSGKVRVWLPHIAVALSSRRVFP